MIKILKIFLRLHRTAALARSLSLASTPMLLIGCLLVLIQRAGLADLRPAASLPLVLALAATLWIPIYLRSRSSLLAIAMRADALLGSRGIISAGADIALASRREPASVWGRLAQAQGLKLLSASPARVIVPRRRYALFAPPLLAGLLLVLVGQVAPAARLSGKIASGSDREKPSLERRFFSAADEKLLTQAANRLKAELADGRTESKDARLESLKNEIRALLAARPENQAELSEVLKKVEAVKKRMQALAQSKQEQLDALAEAGKKLDGKLLSETGKNLQAESLEEAAKSAAELAEKIEGGAKLSDKSMKEAGQDLKEAGAAAAAAGSQAKESSDTDQAPAMEGQDLGQLKNAQEKLESLAQAFEAKGGEDLPAGLKDLAQQFSDLDLEAKQAQEIEGLVDKLDGLKTLMVEAQPGQNPGQGKYADLMEQFQQEAAGQTQEGQQGSQPGASSPGVQSPGSTQADQTSQPSSADQQQQGWGNASTPHLGPATAAGDDAGYQDDQAQGKDSAGPLKKDVIKGAAKKGFVGVPYQKTYDDYASIIDEILDEENVPPLYRYYVNKYFELIAPK